MQTKTKQKLALFILAAAVLCWYWPRVEAVIAMRQPNNSIPYVAPQPAYQPQQPAQPLYVAPQPNQQPQQPQVIIVATPALVGIPQPQPAPVIIDQAPTQPAEDWTDEIRAVNANMQNAIQIVEACALEKITAVTETPPRIVNCQMTLDNLEHAKAKVEELQEAIREGNR